MEQRSVLKDPSPVRPVQIGGSPPLPAPGRKTGRLGATLGKWFDLPVGSTRYTWRKFWADSALAYTFLLPTLAIIGLFSIYPVFRAFYLSLHDWGIGNQGELIGFANYTEILTDKTFWRACLNTLIYVVGTVPVEITLALGLATLLNQKLKGLAFFRLAYFTPYVTTSVAIAIVWRWIYNEEFGVLNWLLGLVGLEPQNWLSDPKWTMFTIILMAVWRSLGYTTIIFLAGLQNMDRELMNAARVDGATERQVFRYVTWPMLSPTTFFVSITSIIGAFKVFTEIFVLYGGGPGPMKAGMTIVYYIYEAAWSEKRMGYASAGAYVLFFMVVAVTAFQFWYAKKRVHYA